MYYVVHNLSKTFLCLLAFIGFCKEYDEVLEHTMKLGLSSEVSQTEENKLKNRYQNIDACKSVTDIVLSGQSGAVDVQTDPPVITCYLLFDSGGCCSRPGAMRYRITSGVHCQHHLAAAG